MLLVSAIQKERVGNRNCKCKTELSRECKIETRSREKMRTVTRKNVLISLYFSCKQKQEHLEPWAF